MFKIIIIVTIINTDNYNCHNYVQEDNYNGDKYIKCWHLHQEEGGKGKAEGKCEASKTEHNKGKPDGWRTSTAKSIKKLGQLLRQN